MSLRCSQLLKPAREAKPVYGFSEATYATISIISSCSSRLETTLFIRADEFQTAGATMTPMKHFLAVFVGCCVLSVMALAQSPSTVIHIINVKWKAEASPAKIKAAIDAVHQLPSKYPGIKRVWTENLKYQGQEGATQAIVMESESLDALKRYEDILSGASRTYQRCPSHGRLKDGQVRCRSGVLLHYRDESYRRWRNECVTASLIDDEAGHAKLHFRIP